MSPPLILILSTYLQLLYIDRAPLCFIAILLLVLLITATLRNSWLAVRLYLDYLHVGARKCMATSNCNGHATLQSTTLDTMVLFVIRFVDFCYFHASTIQVTWHEVMVHCMWDGGDWSPYWHLMFYTCMFGHTLGMDDCQECSEIKTGILLPGS